MPLLVTSWWLMMAAHEAEPFEDRCQQVRQLIWKMSGVQAVGMAESGGQPLVKVYFESRESLEAANLAARIQGVRVETVVSDAFRAN